MKKLLALYYIVLSLVVGGTFLSTMWTKTVDNQHASVRTGLQNEVKDLVATNQQLERQLSSTQALALTSVPEGYQPIKQTIALSQASSLLATR